jgi:hypothetical protein
MMYNRNFKIYNFSQLFSGELRQHITNIHITSVTEPSTEETPIIDTVAVKFKQEENVSVDHFIVEEIVETQEIAEASKWPLQQILEEKQTESCGFCMAPFRTKSGLQRHIERVHANEKIEIQLKSDTTEEPSQNKRKRVSQIDLGYMFQQELQTNTEPDKITSQSVFHCNMCVNKFKTQSNLMRHIEREHSNCDKNQIGKYRCNVCNKTYNHLSTLRHHEQNHGSRKYSCEICSAKYKHSTNLQTHMRKHTQQRKITLKCKKCSKKFQSQGGLLLHDQIHHQNLLHECKLCDSKFKNMMGLYRHAFDHLNFSPYNCPQCAFKNRTKKDFTTHLERKHGIEYVEEIHGCKQSTKEILNFVRKSRNNFVGNEDGDQSLDE